jgi:hypothetical protein
MAGYAGACWRKSSYSMANGNCVETACLADGGVAVRDSKHPDGAVLLFSAPEWKAFIAGVKDREFDYTAR